MSEDLQRLAQRSIRKLNNEEAFEHVGLLIDRSLDAGFARGAKRALFQLDELEQRDLTAEQGALLHYFRANAWHLKARLAGHSQSWTWEQPETQEEILELSRAVTHEGFAALGTVRQCQIITNRANLLNRVGRFIDALEGWDQALQRMPRFAMAQANRGIGLRHYACALHDPGHQALFFLHAYDALVQATAPDAFYDANYPLSVPAGFRELAADIAARIPIDAIRSDQNLDRFSLGRGKREQAYRRWCLAERLFLNPLNDLGSYPIAAHDVLTLPSLTEVCIPKTVNLQIPLIIGLYNQLKQEFVSTRYMFFEGITASGVHFSDRGVLLYNTLDYPSYSLAMERIRASYRIAYSLFDKIAFLINAYWELNKDIEHISFRNVWLEEGGNSKPLLPRFADYENWPLRGLFWLSKEIFDEELSRTTNPDARELHEIRNHLEHKYLQVHEGLLAVAVVPGTTSNSLRKPISSCEIASKALRVMKTARSALIYLSLAIVWEERLRDKRRSQGLSMPMPLTVWRDAWKRSR